MSKRKKPPKTYKFQKGQELVIRNPVDDHGISQGLKVGDIVKVASSFSYTEPSGNDFYYDDLDDEENLVLVKKKGKLHYIECQLLRKPRGLKVRNKVLMMKRYEEEMRKLQL